MMSKQIKYVDIVVLIYDKKMRRYIQTENRVITGRKVIFNQEEGRSLDDRKRIYVEKRGAHYNCLVPVEREMAYTKQENQEPELRKSQRQGKRTEKAKAIEEEKQRKTKRKDAAVDIIEEIANYISITATMQEKKDEEEKEIDEVKVSCICQRANEEENHECVIKCDTCDTSYHCQCIEYMCKHCEKDKAEIMSKSDKQIQVLKRKDQIIDSLSKELKKKQAS